MTDTVLADFENNDDILMQKAKEAQKQRKEAGLEGLTGGLEAVLIMTEPQNLKATVEEFLHDTGFDFANAFATSDYDCCRLTCDNSADFLVCARHDGVVNPFHETNVHPKTEHQPNTRLETFIYSCSDLRKYVEIQTKRGKTFLTDDLIETKNYLFIQTKPSKYTGNSLGFIEWKAQPGSFQNPEDTPLDLTFEKPDLAHLKNIGRLDHTATRVHAQERDDAILEFIDYTSYSFAFAIYVESLNSITNVARLTLAEYAQVFTSGIKPFVSLEESGPTERFMYNYGTRVHHFAFDTKDIENTFAALKENGMEFLVELVGGPDEGLHQTFSKPSPNTFIVNEYIRRYGDFDGFFTKSNVTALTKATENQ